MTDENREVKRTIWRRANGAWRFFAVVGIASAVIPPLLVACLFSMGMHIGPGDPWHGSEAQLRAEFIAEIGPPLALIGFALLCWMDLIRSGRYAWLWGAPWALFAAAVFIFAVLNITAPDAIPCAYFEFMLLTLAGSQVWVAWEAQSLSRKTNTNGGQASA